MIKNKNFYIVGCGGVCTHFLPAFLQTLNHDKSLGNSSVTLIDGDVIEDKNYARQVFDQGLTGMNKAEALVKMYTESNPNVKLQAYTEYVTDAYSIEEKAMVIVFVDNHPARKDILSVVDRHEGTAIIGANGRLSASAYYYDYKWSGTELDPRIRYPEILTIDRGSPVHAAGCNTEQHLDDNPQTPIANKAAATHTLLMWAFWSTESKELDEELSGGFWPVEYRNTEMKMETIKVADLKQ